MPGLLMAGCDGNFVLVPKPDVPVVTGNRSVSTVPETISPTALGDILRHKDKTKGPDGNAVTGNGFG